MNHKLKSLLMLVAVVCSINATAHYYNNVRVNDTPIRCLAQDNSHFIWLGTENGLYCYDGYRCIPKCVLTGGMKATVYCLQSEGNVLYAGTSEGLFVFNTQTYNIQHLPQEQKEVRAIALTDGGAILGMSDGLWRYDTKSNRLQQLSASVKDIYALQHVGNKTYVGALKGFYCCQDGKMKEITLRSDECPYVNSLLTDEQRHCMWVGTGDMLYQYDMASGTVTEIPELKGVSVKSMSLAGDKTLYIATDNGFYTYAEGRMSLDKHDARNPHTLSDDVVWSTFIDHWGNILLGTDGGLSVISAPSYFTYLPISQLTGVSDGNKFSSLFTDSKERKWFGGSNGIFLMDHSNRKWFRQVDKNHPITHNRIRQVYEDLTGNIWIATDNGINLYDEKDGRMRNLIVTDKTGKHTARWAYDIIDDGRGKLWVASFSGGIFIIGKDKLLASEGMVVADKHIRHQKGGLSDTWVRQLKKDSKGNVWARTGKGLDCIDIATGKIKNILRTAPWYIASDRDGNIWVSNPKELLCYTDTETPRHYSYGMERANIETVALCDVNGQIWVVTPKECILIGDDGNNRRLRIPVIDAYGAYYSYTDKCVYIGGQDGMVMMYPAEISENSLQRKLMLTDVTVNGRQRLMGEDGMVLSHNENNIELRLTDFPYTGNVMMSYIYRLEGVDHVWHIMSSPENPIVYNALPHGNYTLRICAINNGAEKKNSELFITKIQVLPPWYLSIGAKLFYALMLQGLILWAIRFYMIRRKLKREKLEKQRILEQSKTRMDFYNNMSRSLKQALCQVMAPLSEMVARSEAGEQRDAISDIRSHTTLMNTLIRKAFDMGNIEVEKDDMPQTRINVVAFCRETVKSMKAAADKRKIELLLETDSPSVLMLTEVLRLDSVLSVLLQSMLRCSAGNSTITVRLKTDSQAGKVGIFINSSSMTMPDDIRPYIFQRYRQQMDNSNVTEMLDDFPLAKDYVEELGGKIALEPADNQGTTVVVLFNSVTVDSVTSSAAKELQTPQDDIISEKDEKLMREITLTIETNMIDSDFNVTRLQETVAVGQKLLYRKIKQIAGVTPVEYIRNIRMEKAARLLREGKFSISEVMYMVGFTKSGYFSKCFQESFGMTPSAYIKNTDNLINKNKTRCTRKL